MRKGQLVKKTKHSFSRDMKVKRLATRLTCTRAGYEPSVLARESQEVLILFNGNGEEGWRRDG